MNDSRVAHQIFSSTLRAMVQIMIPIAMYLIVSGSVSVQEVTNQANASSPESWTSSLSRRLPMLLDSNMAAGYERVTLRLSTDSGSGTDRIVMEAELQCARLLARRMKALNLAVTIRVAEPGQLPLAEVLAAVMIDESHLTSDQIALSVNPDVASNTVELRIVRTLGAEHINETLP